MHYWIDAYNFFFRLTKNYRTMKEHQKKLLEGLYQAMLRLNAPITAVFDGREKDPPEALRRNLRSMNIIYTPAHQTADDYILDMLDHASNPSQEVVVSSDRELLRRSQQRGAQTQTVEAFLQRLSRKKKQATPSERKQLQESSAEFKRLLSLFEKRLQTEDTEE